MLKKRELHESQELYDLMVHPEVFPYVRQKAYSQEEYLFMTKQTIEAEEQGELISRTILDEWGQVIGTINLFEIHNNSGFLGTWIGKPYHGKGYNKIAKELFLKELFFELGIERVFMSIRKVNVRSNKAAVKLPYVTTLEYNTDLFNQFEHKKDQYNIYVISKDMFTMYYLRQTNKQEAIQLQEA